MRGGPSTHVRCLLWLRHFSREQRLIVLGRPSHRLASVVDDDVEAAHEARECIAECLEALEIAQIGPDNVQPVLPAWVVLLRGEASHRVDWEARGRNHLAAAAQQLESDAETNFDARAGDEGDTPIQVAFLGAFDPVELRTPHAQLCVEGVQLPVRPLADVAAARQVQGGWGGLKQCCLGRSGAVVRGAERERWAIRDRASAHPTATARSRLCLERYKARTLRRVERRARIVAATVREEERGVAWLLELLEARQPFRTQHAVVERIPIHLLVPLERRQTIELRAARRATAAPATALASTAATDRFAGHRLRQRTDRLAQRLERLRAKQRQILRYDLEGGDGCPQVVHIHVSKD